MSLQIAHLAHDHSTSGDRTIQEWAEITRRNPDSVMKQVQRRYGTGQYTRNSVMSADQFAELYATQEQQVAAKKKSHVSRQQPETNNQKQEPRKPKPTTAHPFDKRQAILYSLMAIPAIASVQNMYSVTTDIAAHYSTAILLTGLFSATPFLFVLAGMRSHWTKALTGIMIAYECFCNLTRIFGGLTGFGGNGFPTRFLGLVTDIFAFSPMYDKNDAFSGYQYQAGTHETAIVLSAIMAAMAAAVFYTAYYELNRTRT